ncbi:MAG: nucleotide exchange factor GrpE, partial [Candidatus Lokiarchaeota archaeon]|nr:nucleotide exchange factor GrpE [Candidatus Lokiarchaeota archaeon]
ENEKKEEKNEKKKKDKKEKKAKTIEEKYQDALKEIEKWQDKCSYLQAEMENSQKVNLKRIEMARHNIKVDIFKKFLPVVESLESAIQRLEESPDINTNGREQKFLAGFKQVENQFLSILKSAGVKPIQKTDIPFDYNKHDVMMKVTDASKPEDTVIKIVQKGWYLGKNVLRPAKVVVSKKPEPPKEESKEEKPEDKNEKEEKTLEQQSEKNSENEI